MLRKIKESDIDATLEVLNDIWERYRDAWLSINLSDMYFPRKVKDYDWLVKYMNKVQWKPEDSNKWLAKRIKAINEDD